MKADVVIIGAGPAGLTAAIELAKYELSVVVIDEYYRPGGRLLGQHYEDPNAPSTDKLWDGKKIANNLEHEAKKLNVQIYTGVTVWSISKGWNIELSGAEVKKLSSKALLLATGSVEKALPVPGWTLPGVVSIGAAQTFTNLHRIAIGQKVMIMGVDPLSMSVMMEMKKAGIDVVGVALPPLSCIAGNLASPMNILERLTDVVHLAPDPLLRTLGKFSLNKLRNVTAHALRYNLLKIEGVPIHLRKSIQCIEGDHHVEAVILQPVSTNGNPTGEATRVEVDTVCISGGLYPLVDLAQVAGCPLIDIPELGGLVPIHGNDMSTPINGLFLAGNITGIEGAKVAMAQGSLAAISIAQTLGKRTTKTVKDAIKDVEHAREISPLRFLQNIEEGRDKMETIWKNRKKEAI